MDPSQMRGKKGSIISASGMELNDFIHNCRVSGMFDFRAPLYVPHDLELIKRMTIKDFDHFEDHRTIHDEDSESLFANSLFMMKGRKWHELRAALSPAFTGSKMRQMFELVSECADELIGYLLEEAKAGQTDDVEMKDFFSRYTNDVIASCAFGLKVNSLKNRDNDFYLNGKILTNITSIKTMLKLVVMRGCSKLADYFGIDVFDYKATQFFRSIIFDTMRERDEKHIHRPDMINILMQLRQGAISSENEDAANDDAGFATVEESSIGKRIVKRKWTDNQLFSQAMIFFFAGFETSANLLTTLAYEMVANPDIQEELHDEIQMIHEQRAGKRLDYETLQKMKYLDQVVTETLRKWPPFPQVDRVCVKDYHYDDGDLKLNIKKGEALFISIYGVQHDPQYFPNPDRFDPERFSDANKANIMPASLLAFGIGPRNCIGM